MKAVLLDCNSSHCILQHCTTAVKIKTPSLFTDVFDEALNYFIKPLSLHILSDILYSAMRSTKKPSLCMPKFTVLLGKVTMQVFMNLK